jgi:hypothetical protein
MLYQRIQPPIKGTTCIFWHGLIVCPLPGLSRTEHWVQPLTRPAGHSCSGGHRPLIPLSSEVGKRRAPNFKLAAEGYRG